jgi:pimeloyl-ACP methyl ester carboxylesterase
MEYYLNWYRAVVADVSYEEEQGIIIIFFQFFSLSVQPYAERSISELPEGREFIKQPTLMLFTHKDYACQPALYGHMPQFISDLETEDFDTSHWITWEQPDKVNSVVESFISRKVKV